MTAILVLSIFGGLFALCLAYLYLFLPRIYFRLRLKRLFKTMNPPPKNKEAEPIKNKRLAVWYQRVEAEVQAAELPVTTREFLLILMWLNLASLVLLLLLGWIALLILLLVNASAFILLRVFQMRRQQMLVQLLPDVLILMSNALKAGYSIVQTIDLLSREDFGPLSKEFGKLSQALRYGENFEKAFQNFAATLNLHEIDTVVDTILITRETGGNLTNVIDSLVLILEENQRLLGEVRSLTAQGRISALVVGMLPSAFFLFMYLFNPFYIMILFESTLGISMLIVAVLMQIAGFIIMNKLIKLKVR
ncbi:type II secretion system F family protein [Brevibacillus dissolubilis]|uniref:type II secretion system F family protein n=1 Tax=Brevibacillus dissolubilis TaxID=1844116 RepID=UPI00111743CF|nr:type II secretion system F family protein [Brevibacillus dissolubilis]